MGEILRVKLFCLYDVRASMRLCIHVQALLDVAPPTAPPPPPPTLLLWRIGFISIEITIRIIIIIIINNNKQ